MTANFFMVTRAGKRLESSRGSMRSAWLPADCRSGVGFRCGAGGRSGHTRPPGMAVPRPTPVLIETGQARRVANPSAPERTSP